MPTPTPRDPPVTTATFPSSEPMVLPLVRSHHRPNAFWSSPSVRFIPMETPDQPSESDRYRSGHGQRCRGQRADSVVLQLGVEVGRDPVCVLGRSYVQGGWDPVLDTDPECAR